MPLAGILVMLRAMKPLKHRLLRVLTLLFFAGALPWARAELHANPYQAVVARNAFGLKAAVPEAKVTPPGRAIQPPKVILTGIVSVFGSVRALLEITEQEPGKAANTEKPILREGQRCGPVELISIDYHKGTVKVRINGAETDLSFPPPKVTASDATPPLPGVVSSGVYVVFDL